MASFPDAAQYWAKETWIEGMKRVFWKKFMSKSVDNVIQIKDELTKEPGDRVNFSFLKKVPPTSVITETQSSGYQTLIGNEADFNYYNDSVLIGEAKVAIRLPGKFREQLYANDLPKDAKVVVGNCIAEYQDYMIFQHLCGNTGYGFPENPVAPDADHHYLHGKADEASLTTGDEFDTATIDACVEMAQLADPIIEPLRMDDGTLSYIMVIHPKDYTNLRQDSDWKSAQQANVRGNKNPLFNGVDILSSAAGMWNNTAIFVHPWIVTPQSGVSRSIFCGKQAGALAICKKKRFVIDDKSDKADYGQKPGIAMFVDEGFCKAVFNFKDLSVITASNYIG